MKANPPARNREGASNLYSEKANRIRISPAKTRDNTFTRRSIQPFASSIIDKNKVLSKQDIAKMSSKLELIKSKCMKTSNLMDLNNSRKTLKSDWLGEQCDDSIDIDSDDGLTSATRTAQAHQLLSPYPDRPPTIFFHYPKCCVAQHPESVHKRVVPIDNPNLKYRIAGSEYRCIVNCFEQNGFRKCETGTSWNVYFDISGSHLKQLESIRSNQKFNHFPGCWNVGRKDSLWRHLNRNRRSHPAAYAFIPITYLFPSDFERFEMARQNAAKSRLWIMKPAAQACGRGIKMVTRDTKLKCKKDTLVSQYISNPHLINNFKYDLRIYVLVTSYDPLRIYIFEEGLTRFATYEYNNKAKDVKKRYIHLTNFSVNKHSKKYVKNAKVEVDGQGSKWSLTALKKHYDDHGLDSKKIFESIHEVIIKTCISAQPIMLDIHSKTQEKRNCGFEIYGFDILMDDKLKPWLMEVNVCPSLSSSSPIDRKIKHTLLADTLNLIGIENTTKKQAEEKKGRSRLITRQNRKYYSRNIHNLATLDYSNCLEILSPEDWLMLFESQQEMHRKGHFERIFPKVETLQRYTHLFEFNRYNNLVLWKSLQSSKDFLELITG